MSRLMRQAHTGRSIRSGVLTIALLATVISPGWAGARAGLHDDHSGVRPYPAHIHTGTCDALGGVEYPLTDAGQQDGDQEGTNPAVIIAESTTTIPASLDDLLAEPHALNVHLSADDMGTYVACGDLGGVVVEDRLVIGLAELNGSGLSGIGILTATGDETEARFFLSLAKPEDDGGGVVASPSASPEAGAAVEAEVTVEITDFAYRDATLEVPVGTTVRWVNNDLFPHTVTSTSDDRALASGDMSKGDEFTFTFTEPGTYEYICSFHDNMTGSVVVS